ncbi:MAG TPA: alkaline phosphatase family protein, partial [Verrucomicrobiae bacterium]
MLSVGESVLMLLVIPFNRTRFFIATALFGAFAMQTTFGAVPYVVHMSLDGLGALYLQPYVTAAPGEYPNFVRLQTQGAFTYNARCDFGASETIPNHACMFTGRPALQPAGFPNTTHHGYINNAPPPGDTYHNAGNLNVPYKASVFDVVHDNGLS